MFKRHHSQFVFCLVLALATLLYGCTPILPKSKIEFGQATQAQTPQPDQVLTGEVIKVFDGDTILLKDQTGTATKIRLKGIDAPEGSQSYGPEAAKKMTELSLNKVAEVQFSEVDQYGRTIGKVTIGETDICLEMLKAGLAWHFKQYQRAQNADDRLAYDKAEKEARQQREGLWKEEKPTPPWEYRRQQRMKSNDNSGNGDRPPSDDHLTALTISQMEETARVSELSDLALVLELRDSSLSDDSRVYELLSRIYPNWLNESESSDASNPTHIAFTIPISAAYDEMAYGHCRCAGPEAPIDGETSPCIYCACQASLFRATKNDDFKPRPRLA